MSVSGLQSNKPILITGGAGFVGVNLAHRLLSEGRQVIIYDNLSRSGAEKNLDWVRSVHPERLEVVIGDVRDRETLTPQVQRASQVFHCAAQVAVSTSLVSPVEDFEINAGGTLNVLEASRTTPVPPGVIFTSTNKVYGGLEDLTLEARETRYAAAGDGPEAIDATRPLDFHSPYGCSKGAADQYVIDYARSYGIPAVVFRMSCVYGPHQYGTEDQGWVAHFLIRALDGEPITIYGDGRQVRDILFVEDLVDAFLVTAERIDRLSGNAFNIGGGLRNSTSLLEIIERIEGLTGVRPEVSMAAWRTGDQRYYVSDNRELTRATGWQPRVGIDEGLARLHEWLQAARGERTGTRVPTRRVAVADHAIRVVSAS
jgi:CDP-paratose 2-epimerase